MDTLRAQIQSITDDNKSLRAQLSSALQPPEIPTPDTFLPLLLPRIQEAVRRDLTPVLLEHRRKIAEQMRERAQFESQIREKVDRVVLIPSMLQTVMGREVERETAQVGPLFTNGVGVQNGAHLGPAAVNGMYAPRSTFPP